MLEEIWGGRVALGGPRPRAASRSLSSVASGLT